jgi:hypothetical protein
VKMADRAESTDWFLGYISIMFVLYILCSIIWEGSRGGGHYRE